MSNFMYGSLIVLFLAIAVSAAVIPEKYSIDFTKPASEKEEKPRVIYVECKQVNYDLLADLPKHQRIKIQKEILEDEILDVRARLKLGNYDADDYRKIVLEDRLVNLRKELADLK